jgi:long-chain acyl-CoA synthetase
MTKRRLTQVITEQAESLREAIIEDECRLTYAQLVAQIRALAHTLWHRYQVRPGHKVALMFYNQKEFLIGFMACRWIGAIAVPVNIQLPPEDIAYVLQNSESRLLIITRDLAQQLLDMVAGGQRERFPLPLLIANDDEHDYTSDDDSFEGAIRQGDPEFSPPEDVANGINPDDLSVLIYTSGTTGRPKGVMLSESNLLANMDGITQTLSLNPDEHTMMLALPLFHAFGLIVALYGMSLHAPIVLVPRFLPKKIFQAVVEEHVTIMPLVPTMFTMLLEAANRLGADAFRDLHYCISGGAALPPELLARIESTLNVTVLEGYGLTETSPVVAVNSPLRGSIPGAVGKPLHNVQVKLVDEQNRTLPVAVGAVSAEGEILVKGPSVMMGYYKLPEYTERAFDADGWFRTGDLGRFDGEGNLLISGGRKKDLIIKAGENISPLSIERVLYKCPAIMEASVIGVAHEKLGEAILACVQLREGQQMTESELRAYCREHLPPFMLPDAFLFYDELPKSPAGKILKKRLREENPTLPVSRSAS